MPVGAYFRTEKHRKRISQSLRRTYQEHPEWWKQTEERKKKTSETVRRAYQEHPEYREKISERLKNLSFEVLTRRGQAISKTFREHPEIRKRISEKMYEIGNKPENRKRLSEMTKNLWKNPEYAKKCLCFGKPNQTEIYLDNILQRHFLNEWKYVGDGRVVIDGKCPDWINCNGKKLLIELFGVNWHLPDDEEKRIEFFSKYGFRTLVIWDYELIESAVVSRVEEFMTAG